MMSEPVKTKVDVSKIKAMIKVAEEGRHCQIVYQHNDQKLMTDLAIKAKDKALASLIDMLKRELLD